MILTLVGVSEGTLHETARRAKGIGADIVVRPPGTSIISLSAAPMSDKMLGFFGQQPHVTQAMGTIVNPLGGFDTITGVDLAQFTRMSGGFRYVAGGPFERRLDIIVDDFFARQRKLSVGGTIELMSQNWRVAGIVEPGKMGRVFCQLTTLQELTSNSNKLSQIFLKVNDEKQAQAVVDGLRIQLPKYFIYTMEEFTSLISISNVSMLRGFIYVVIGNRGDRGLYRCVYGDVHGGARAHARNRDFEGVGRFPGDGHRHSFPRDGSHRFVRHVDGHSVELRHAICDRHDDSGDAGAGNSTPVVADFGCDRGVGCAAGYNLSGLAGSPAGCDRGAEL